MNIIDSASEELFLMDYLLKDECTLPNAIKPEMNNVIKKITI